MNVLSDYILGSSSNPVEMAVNFLMFVLVIDCIFHVINELLSGVRR